MNTKARAQYPDLAALFAAIDTDANRLENRAYVLMGHYLLQIEQEMERQGCSQKQLADALEVSPSYISQVFQADKLLTFRQLARIERALDMQFAQQPLVETDQVRNHAPEQRVPKGPVASSMYVQTLDWGSDEQHVEDAPQALAA
ncbi:MAG: helix-turn-helix domain-containing protein [Gammaproteobacteria bacterium]